MAKRFLGCFVKEEFLKITGALKSYLKNIDETLYLSSIKNKGEIRGKTMSSAVVKQTMADKSASVKPFAARQNPACSGAEISAESAKGAIMAAESEASYNMAKKEKNSEDTMKSMYNEVKKCKKCMLGLSRLNPVFGVGDINADVVFVGEGPGFQEDHTGEPFIGRSGQLLDKIFASIELSRESVYITNIVKCHPMVNPETPEAHGNDRPPTPEEISICRNYLERQIELIKPKCIVTLGSVSAKVLLCEKRGISLLRGKWYDAPSDFFAFSKNIKILPMYHPAALLRNPNLKKDTWHDMKMLRDFLKKNK